MYKTLHKKQGSVTVQLRFARSSVTFCAPRDTWEKEADFKAHCGSELVQSCNALYKKYVEAEVSDVYEK